MFWIVGGTFAFQWVNFGFVLFAEAFQFVVGITERDTSENNDNDQPLLEPQSHVAHPDHAAESRHHATTATAEATVYPNRHQPRPVHRWSEHPDPGALHPDHYQDGQSEQLSDRRRRFHFGAEDCGRDSGQQFLHDVSGTGCGHQECVHDLQHRTDTAAANRHHTRWHTSEDRIAVNLMEKLESFSSHMG